MTTPVDIRCRPATAKDADHIADFNCRLARETESLSLDSKLVRAGVTRGLELAPEVRYFVAEVDNLIVGQLMITREWSDWRNGWMIWLQSVYVDKAFRKVGVFRALFASVQKLVTENSEAVGIRLYVETENIAAHGAYSRLGFRDSGYQVLELPIA